MNKYIILLLLVFFYISIFAYYTSINLPYSNCSYETFPYFFNIYNNENYLSFFYNQYNFDELTNNRENNIMSLFYDISYKRIYYSDDMNIAFLDNKRNDNLYYGINLINNTLINNIHSSLFLQNNNYFISGYSNFIKQSYNPYLYYNQLFFSYKNLAAFSTLNTNEKEFLLGYIDKNILILSGYNNAHYIPINIKINEFNFSLFTNLQYYYDTKNYEYNIKLMYYNYFNRLHFLPSIKYINDSLNILGGLLFRLYPDISIFSNYNYEKEKVSSGIKFYNNNIFANYQLSYFYTINQMRNELSFLLNKKYLSFSFNFEYTDSLIFRSEILLKTYFYNGNLQPQVFISYDYSDLLRTFLNIKLIDAFLILGSEWDLDKKTYLLNGGIQWYFYETLQ